MSPAGQVIDLLRGYQFNHIGEQALQDGLQTVLADNGLLFDREVRLGPAGRIDFLSPDGLGVEVKAKRDCGVGELMRQLFRYAAHERVTGLLVVTTDARHLQVPEVMAGKPVEVFVTRRAFS